jgi:hypothetical protein
VWWRNTVIRENGWEPGMVRSVAVLTSTEDRVHRQIKAVRHVTCTFENLTLNITKIFDPNKTPFLFLSFSLSRNLLSSLHHASRAASSPSCPLSFLSKVLLSSLPDPLSCRQITRRYRAAAGYAFRP